jgi:hypothetical protein
MKNTHYTRLLLGLVSIVLIVFSASCRRDRNTNDNSAVDNSNAENLFSDMFKVVDDVSSQQEGIREDNIGCIDTIIVDTTAWPRTVLIDFGSDNCLGEDGRIRNGQIIVTYTGRYRDEGTIITVTPNNYTINGYELSGTKIITNLGTNDEGFLHYSIAVDGQIAAPANAWQSSWESTRVRTWVEGSSTLTPWDDAYEITGSASGINRNGDAYTMAITSPLRAEIGCPWLVSGVVNIVPEENDARVVDFGSGDCNNGFTVTVGNEVYTFGSGD